MQNKKDQVMVTIGMTTYGQEAYIREALDSLVAQKTNFSFEIVVGEDCSPDNTREILEEYNKRYPNKFVLLLHENNIGFMNNYKTVLEASQGKYFALCEGDDYWNDENKLQKQVEFLEANIDYTGIHTKTIYVDSESNIKGCSNRVTKGNEVVDYTYIAQQSTIHTCSFMYRSELIDDEFMSILDQSSVGDLPLFLKASLEGKIAYIDEAMSTYRVGVGVMQQWKVERGYLNIIEIYEAFEKLSRYEKIKKITNLSKRYQYYKLAQVYTQENQYLKSITAYSHMLYYTYFTLTSKYEVVNKVSFFAYIKTGIYTIPYLQKAYVFFSRNILGRNY